MDKNKVLFKSELKQLLTLTCQSAGLLASGHIAFSPGWKDLTVQAGLGSATIVTTGTIGILAAAGLIMSIPGIAIPIGLLGLGSGIGFNLYRSTKKKNEGMRLAHLFYGLDIDATLDQIVDIIYGLYQQTIEHLQPEGVQTFTDALSKCLSYGLMKGKIKSIDDLLDPGTLHETLLDLRHHIPKKTLKTTYEDGKKRNARSAIVKTGIYYEGATSLYKQDKGRISKYGAANLRDIGTALDFMSRVEEKYAYKQQNKEKMSLLLSQSLFEPKKEREKMKMTEDSLDSAEWDLTNFAYAADSSDSEKDEFVI